MNVFQLYSGEFTVTIMLNEILHINLSNSKLSRHPTIQRVRLNGFGCQKILACTQILAIPAWFPFQMRDVL